MVLPLGWRGLLPARRLARQQGETIIRPAGQEPSRRQSLSSNVGHLDIENCHRHINGACAHPGGLRNQRRESTVPSGVGFDKVRAHTGRLS